MHCGSCWPECFLYWWLLHMFSPLKSMHFSPSFKLWCYWFTKWAAWHLNSWLGSSCCCRRKGWGNEKRANEYWSGKNIICAFLKFLVMVFKKLRVFWIAKWWANWQKLGGLLRKTPLLGSSILLGLFYSIGFSIELPSFSPKKWLNYF